MNGYEKYEDVVILVPTKVLFFPIVIEPNKEKLINYSYRCSIFA